MGEEDQSIPSRHRRHRQSPLAIVPEFIGGRPDLFVNHDPIVQTRHDYEITHKFTWKCAGCDATCVPASVVAFRRRVAESPCS